MREILRIAKTELQTMFYSPVAWFVLIVFIVQTGSLFFGVLDGIASSWEYYKGGSNSTMSLFVYNGGINSTVISYLFMYIPLLTMGIISREISSGSIKLLYSSPITNSQIIFGKYLSMVAYVFLLALVLVCYGVIAIITVDNADIPLIFTGILGVFLLACAYAAVGVFISSFTSYQIVAALGTFVVLTLLNYVGGWGQTIPFVREVTYWLAMPGRANTFVSGIICTEDLIYFITISLLFLYLTIIHLKLKREANGKCKRVKYYGILLLSVLAVSYITTRPSMKIYWDVARFEPNTLTKASQEIVGAIGDEGMVITTYTNIFDSNMAYYGTPAYQLMDIADMSQYTRFKPDTKLKYEYYYTKNHPGYQKLKQRYAEDKLTDDEILEKVANDFSIPLRDIYTEEEILKIEPVIGEDGFQIIKVVELENGKKGYIRYFDDATVIPDESNISSGLKRLTSLDFPKVAFVGGHDERTGFDEGGINYSSFVKKKKRYSLYNQGFDITSVTLDKVVPADINIMIIADIRKPFTEIEFKNYQQYIDRGGNLLILGEPFRENLTNEIIKPFGMELQPGVVVQPFGGNKADVLFLRPTKETTEISYHFDAFYNLDQYTMSSNRATSVKMVEDKGFDVRPLFVTDTINGGSHAWVELEQKYFEEAPPVVNGNVGETANGPITMMYALNRKIGDRTQKIIIGGDADIISTAELSTSYWSFRRQTQNNTFIYGAFNWFSDNQSPVDMRRPAPIDNKYNSTVSTTRDVRSIFIYLLPAFLLAFSIFLTLRRRSK